MYYTREEIAILPLFMKRVLVKPFYDTHKGLPRTPESVSVEKRAGSLYLVICHNNILPITGITDFESHIKAIGHSYSLNIKEVYILSHKLSSYFRPHGDYFIYRDLTTKGTLNYFK